MIITVQYIYYYNILANVIYRIDIFARHIIDYIMI